MVAAAADVQIATTARANDATTAATTTTAAATLASKAIATTSATTATTATATTTTTTTKAAATTSSTLANANSSSNSSSSNSSNSNSSSVEFAAFGAASASGTQAANSNLNNNSLNIERSACSNNNNNSSSSNNNNMSDTIIAIDAAATATTAAAAAGEPGADAVGGVVAVPSKSAVSQRNVDIKIERTGNMEAATQQLTKKVLKLDLGGKNLDEYSLKSPKSPITARLPHQTSLTSSVDVEDRKTLREALYQGIFHRHRRTIFAVGSFLRMLRSRNSQYNTIRSSSEGEDIDEVR